MVVDAKPRERVKAIFNAQKKREENGKGNEKKIGAGVSREWCWLNSLPNKYAIFFSHLKIHFRSSFWCCAVHTTFTQWRMKWNGNH